MTYFPGEKCPREDWLLPSRTRPRRRNGMRAIGLFGMALLAACAGLRGASYWQFSNAQVDEKIADAGTAKASLTPVQSDIPFGVFRYPHVDSLENVTFIVDPGKNHGIYRSSPVDRTLSELVTSGETQLPAPAGKADYIRGLQMDGEDFLFNALDTNEGRGLYLSKGGSLTLLARTGVTTLPGDSGPLKDVEYGSLAGRYALYTAEGPDRVSLVLQNVENGENRVLLRSGQVIPGREGKAFQYFSPQNWLKGEDLVFRAATVVDPHVDRTKDGAGVRGLYGWFGQPSINPGGYRLSDLRTIADWTTPIPGMEGKCFTDFRSAPVDKGLVAFVGGGEGCQGVYLYNAHAKEPKPRVIVDSETELPGLFPGTFKDFGIFPTVIGDNVVFTARTASDFAGVFLYNAGTDKLFVLADNRTEIDGKAVRGFEIAGHFLVRNRFAIAVYFRDRTSGIYLATIPVEGFARMGAPGF